MYKWVRYPAAALTPVTVRHKDMNKPEWQLEILCQEGQYRGGNLALTQPCNSVATCLSIRTLRAPAPCQHGQCTHHSCSSQKESGCRSPRELATALSRCPYNLSAGREGASCPLTQSPLPSVAKETSPLGKLGVALGIEEGLGKRGGNSLPLTKEV